MLKKIRVIWLILLFLVIFNASSVAVWATSSYVLPYPSSMPGSKLYELRLLEEKISYYWHFGNFSKFRYYLELSDRYLVEAKTLFEYKQYLLAHDALLKSDQFYSHAAEYLIKAEREGKNISEKKQLFIEAGGKHKELINTLKDELPASFKWIPEKGEPQDLEIAEALENSIKKRNNR